MRNNKRNNEISELCKMLQTVIDNLSEKRNYSHTDVQFFNLLRTTEKNYFTTIEREDIFLIACHIQNLNDEIISAKNGNNHYSILLKDCIEMLRELEKLPKCNSITNLYEKFRQQYYNSLIFDSHAHYCKKIADSIYFSYLKNT